MGDVRKAEFLGEKLKTTDKYETTYTPEGTTSEGRIFRMQRLKDEIINAEKRGDYKKAAILKKVLQEMVRIAPPERQFWTGGWIEHYPSGILIASDKETLQSYIENAVEEEVSGLFDVFKNIGKGAKYLIPVYGPYLLIRDIRRKIIGDKVLMRKIKAECGVIKDENQRKACIKHKLEESKHIKEAQKKAEEKEKGKEKKGKKHEKKGVHESIGYVVVDVGEEVAAAPLLATLLPMLIAGLVDLINKKLGKGENIEDIKPEEVPQLPEEQKYSKEIEKAEKEAEKEEGGIIGMVKKYWWIGAVGLGSYLLLGRRRQ
jgi:hypothetical protein